MISNKNSMDYFSEKEDETNQEIIKRQSSNISLSSGSVELLGLEKDSESETESSSYKGVTPTHDFSFKSQEDLLKCNLKITTSEKSYLEELIAKMSEKSERLQYELADAKEITRNRDEVIKLLQHQLSRMEDAYTKSLEESIFSKLQLTSHEQEIHHLKKMCYKYEEEKNKSANEINCKNIDKLIFNIKKLVSEKEKLKEEIVQLEKEKLSLVNYLKEIKNTKEEHQHQGWKDRCKEEQIGINKEEIEKINDTNKRFKELNYKKEKTVFKIDAENLKDLSKFEFLTFRKNLKKKSAHWCISNLNKNNCTFARRKAPSRKQKETKLLSNQCEFKKEFFNNNFEKNYLIFHSIKGNISLDEIVKRKNKGKPN